MKKTLGRSLTHVFGMTRRRDRVLGDLLYSLRSEGLTAHAEGLAEKLAFYYYKSPDVAKCLVATVDFVDETEGPGTAHRLCHALAMTAQSGPVSMLLAVKLPELEKRAEKEPGIRKATVRLLDRIRLQTQDEIGNGIRPTIMCWDHDDQRMSSRIIGLLKPTPPHEFVYEIRR